MPRRLMSLAGSANDCARTEDGDGVSEVIPGCAVVRHESLSLHPYVVGVFLENVRAPLFRAPGAVLAKHADEGLIS